MKSPTIPKLITFDGEARTGKGTIVQRVKDYLRDECGYKVMLIDRGQTFRVLVVAAIRAGVDPDDPAAIDMFLSDKANITQCVRLVKDVYHMSKRERDTLLYTNAVGENSAKVGARSLSQEFVKNLTKKWLHDAGDEGFDVVLIDGRALEAIGTEMDEEKLCDYRLGLYFTCDYTVGARRTLGYATIPYASLDQVKKAEVDVLVQQIEQRNQRDFDRESERLTPPVNAATYRLPDVPQVITSRPRPMIIFDTSADMTKSEMALPVAKLIASAL